MIPVVYAKATQVVHVGYAPVTVQGGSHWVADDPVVIAHPHLFSADERYGLQWTRQPDGWDAPPVEQATAAPGERRAKGRNQ